MLVSGIRINDRGVAREILCLPVLVRRFRGRGARLGSSERGSDQPEREGRQLELVSGHRLHLSRREDAQDKLRGRKPGNLTGSDNRVGGGKV